MVRPRTRPSAKVPDNPATDAPLPPTGSSSNGLNVMEEKIKGIEDKIEGIKLKMDEMDKKLNKLVNHMKMKEDVADQQARLGSELCKIRDLSDSDICRAIKALSTGMIR
ncbi:uncharacterized protein LOC133829532 [Humulus lupulus]|uniref:uncharacterized protein LOC133829532 n=1 Tax=Humulus lupulus TaxID=3486 RepID=UPI002B40117C|nr:uncharacterized protein LOC133829532 [Humulus lupulus]XP_062115222.1 uncharacterized protein LOC133829532 [Humulus lupulus]XP_062115223.1 uncharacterized protein LOC133829532 [Humulus lupulus]